MQTGDSIIIFVLVLCIHSTFQYLPVAITNTLKKIGDFCDMSFIEFFLMLQTHSQQPTCPLLHVAAKKYDMIAIVLQIQ